MNWYWPLAVLILGVLLFSYCTYTANKAGRSLDSGLDSLDNQACYQAGYNAAFAGRSEAPTSGGDEECARWLDSGFADGRRIYKAYEEPFH